MVKIWDCTVWKHARLSYCQLHFRCSHSNHCTMLIMNESFSFLKKKRPSHWRLMALNKIFTKIHVISCVLASWNNLIMYWLSVLKLEGSGEAVPWNWAELISWILFITYSVAPTCLLLCFWVLCWFIWDLWFCVMYGWCICWCRHK